MDATSEASCPAGQCMNVTKTEIPDVVMFEPQTFADDRGVFFESFNEARFEASLNRRIRFVQDNQSVSHYGVVRGLHYQVSPKAQAKLVRVIKGEIFDVSVDLRKGSAFFGRWVARVLSDVNRRQLWIPEGFAHGFKTLSDSAVVVYKTTDYWSAAHERCVRWNDERLRIDWPESDVTILSAKDRDGASFEHAELC